MKCSVPLRREWKHNSILENPKPTTNLGNTVSSYFIFLIRVLFWGHLSWPHNVAIVTALQLLSVYQCLYSVLTWSPSGKYQGVAMMAHIITDFSALFLFLFEKSTY